MTEHTPGPWTARGTSVTHTDAHSLVCTCHVHYGDNPEGARMDAANARLIAAAPDLLEAARVLLETVDQVLADGDERALYEPYDAMRAAIEEAIS